LKKIEPTNKKDQKNSGRKLKKGGKNGHNNNDELKKMD